MNIIKTGADVLHAHVKRHCVEYLISAAFFMGGGYFLYQLIGILFEYIVSASVQDWVDALPGMIILFVFALLISWPGMYMAAADSIVVDLRLGIIIRRKEWFGLHTRGKMILLGDVECIVCRPKTQSRTRRTVGSTSKTNVSVTCYIVGLNLKNDQQAEVLEYAEINGARELARAIAEFTGISLDDRL